MKLYNPNITGSLIIDADIFITGSFNENNILYPSASYAISASYAENGGFAPSGSGVGDKIFLWQNFK